MTERPERFIRNVEAQKITGLSQKTMYRLQESAGFPRPYRLSPGIVAYKESELVEWIDSRSQEICYE